VLDAGFDPIAIKADNNRRDLEGAWGEARQIASGFDGSRFDSMALSIGSHPADRKPGSTAGLS
jgi:hypothetical protein